MKIISESFFSSILYTWLIISSMTSHCSSTNRLQSHFSLKKHLAIKSKILLKWIWYLPSSHLLQPFFKQFWSWKSSLEGIVVLWRWTLFQTHKVMTVEVFYLPYSRTGMPSHSFDDHAFANKWFSYLLFKENRIAIISKS